MKFRAIIPFSSYQPFGNYQPSLADPSYGHRKPQRTGCAFLQQTRRAEFSTILLANFRRFLLPHPRHRGSALHLDSEKGSVYKHHPTEENKSPLGKASSNPVFNETYCPLKRGGPFS